MGSVVVDGAGGPRFGLPGHVDGLGDGLVEAAVVGDRLPGHAGEGVFVVDDLVADGGTDRDGGGGTVVAVHAAQVGGAGQGLEGAGPDLGDDGGVPAELAPGLALGLDDAVVVGVMPGGRAS